MNRKRVGPLSVPHQTFNHKGNKLLAFTQRRIPYLPELKQRCGSVCASILMQQLEYWFAQRPDGFYKFLEPCAHEDYKPQDSWTEELHFSLREFRGAFDKIGVRYKSKKQLKTVLASDQDPFEGRFYLSYIDVRSGHTFYLRNHVVVDAMLTDLLNSYTPSEPPNNSQPPDISRDAVLSFPEITKRHPQKLQNVTSGDDKTTSLYKEQKITNKDDTKTTTAIPPEQTATQETTDQTNALSFAAAVLKKNKTKAMSSTQAATPPSKSNTHTATNTPSLVVDNVIGEQLTPLQQRYLECVHTSVQSQFPDVTPEVLLAGMTHTLCDPQAFTQAGSDFFKKLNTLQKTIQRGGWQVPAAVIKTKQQSVINHRRELEAQIRELEGDRAHLSRMLSVLSKTEDDRVFASLERQLFECNLKINQLIKTIEQGDQP